NDDITKLTLAEYFNTKLVTNNKVLSQIKTVLSAKKVIINARNTKQAEVPESCQILQNNLGTAPGMWFNENNKVYISLPGVPFEMKDIIVNEVIPKLKKQFTGNFIIHKNIITHEIPESELAEKLEKWENNLPNDISLAYLPSPGIVKLRLSARGKKEGKLLSSINNEIEKLFEIIPNNIISTNNDSLEKQIGELLIKNNQSLSTAESCTGGNIAHLITLMPGCSVFFKGSIVAYSNEIKQNLLNVTSCNIDEFGAVSKVVVEEMAKGARNKLNSDYSIATSGIAGPSGGTNEKPVGTIWIAVSSKEKTISKKFTFNNTREVIIKKSSFAGLNMLKKLLIEKKLKIM
ncbi:MAG: nicotinamide-nucleotide amidohydrolase family protein, partial [Bacteroidota bacterium]|nr:nicotinamide-nucleotide amidohydrolase family protein [Bacteroidota bacterium]